MFVEIYLQVGLTTDLTLSFVQTLELYQIRWTIEVLFKECKQYLSLGQSQNTDFDGQIADATLALITHTILTLNKRFEDYETTGAIYRQVQQDLLELTLYERLLRILAKVVLVLVDMFGIDVNEAMEKMIANENIPQQLINVVMELNKTRDNQIKSTETVNVAAYG
jgi:sulfite exporter TauE/SafE